MTGRPVIALLGAGGSRRFGPDNKLLMPCGGKPLGQWGLDAALACDAETLWIHGDDLPDFVPAACLTLHNPAWRDGLGTSIAGAARFAAGRAAAALLILPADMPFVTAGLLQRLLATPAPAACRYPDGHTGVPTVFAPAHFTALSRVAGAAGAGAILRDDPDLSVLATDPWQLFDVDRPEDLVHADKAFRARAPI